MCWECQIVDLSRMSNCRPVENVELSTCRECQIVNLSRMSNCRHEFSTFSTLNTMSNEFSSHQLYMSTLIYTRHRQPCFILLAVTWGHTNLILCNRHERQTIHYCFDSWCFHIKTVLPLSTVQNVSVFICLPPIIWVKVEENTRIFYRKV